MQLLPHPLVLKGVKYRPLLLTVAGWSFEVLEDSPRVRKSQRLGFPYLLVPENDRVLMGIADPATPRAGQQELPAAWPLLVEYFALG